MCCTCVCVRCSGSWPTSCPQAAPAERGERSQTPVPTACAAACAAYCLRCLAPLPGRAQPAAGQRVSSYTTLIPHSLCTPTPCLLLLLPSHAPLPGRGPRRLPVEGEKQYAVEQLRGGARRARTPFVSVREASGQELAPALERVLRRYEAMRGLAVKRQALLGGKEQRQQQQ